MKRCLIRLIYDKRFGSKTELNFNCTRVKEVLFWGEFNETFRLDASWCRMKPCLTKLIYDKRFGGKTETYYLNEQEHSKSFFGANLIKL
jgi:hypothetical protein